MIDICQWRSCIGSWNCRRLSSYCNSCSTSIRSMLGAFTDGLLVLTLSLVLVFLSLLIISGDIELNPGPGQPPQLDDVYRLLKPHSIQWQDIGRELGVTKKPRMESLEEALKHTLSQWIESQCSEVSWDHLITVLVGLGMVCAAKEIREYLVIDAGAKEKYRWMEADIQNEVNKQHGKISEILQSFPEKHTKQPKGIIFIFGMTAGVIGVTKDVELVREMFEDYLQFAYHRVENMTCSELIIIIKAAVTYTSYPRFCKHICFYFAGHGGIDKNQQPFFKAGTSFNSEKDKVVYIEKDILSQFQCVGKKEFILFFDCCFNEVDSDYKVLSCDKLFKAPPHCLVACAAQYGRKAYGDKENGGRWTASLCKHIKEPIELTVVLAKVNKEVMEKSKVDASTELPPQSWFRSNIGPVCLLKGDDPEHPRLTPQEKKKYEVTRTAVLRYVDCLKKKFREEFVVEHDWLPQLRMDQDYYGRLVLLEKGKTDVKSANEDEQQKINKMMRGEIDKISSADTRQSKQIKITDILQSNDCQNSSPRIVLIDGTPGIGKTTLCYKMLNMWAKDELFTEQFTVVLYCSLRDENIVESKKLINLIEAVYYVDSELEYISQYFTDNHGEGLLLIFDGWDELSTQHKKDSLPARIIKRKMLHKSTVIVTSRTYATKSLLELIREKFKHIEVIGFLNDEINEVIKNTFSDDDSRHLANKLIDELNVQTHTRSLCYVPLICRIVIFLYQESNELPQQLTEMYKNFILETIKRDIKNRTKKELYCDSLDDLPLDDIAPHLEKLSSFAYLCLKENNPKMTFNRAELDKINNGRNADCGYLGLMTTVTVYRKELYQFLHLTIQEFLAAWWISRKNDRVEKAFEEHFENDHFRMCLKFTAGLTGLKSEYFKNNYFNKCFDLRCSLVNYNQCCKMYRSRDLPLRLLHLLYESKNTELCKLLAQSVDDNSFCVDRITDHWYPYDGLCFLYFLGNSEITWNSIHIFMESELPNIHTDSCAFIRCKKTLMENVISLDSALGFIRLMSHDYLTDLQLNTVSACFDTVMKRLMELPHKLKRVSFSCCYTEDDYHNYDKHQLNWDITKATSLKELDVSVFFDDDYEWLELGDLQFQFEQKMTYNVLKRIAKSNTITSLEMKGFSYSADAINELFKSNKKLEKLCLMRRYKRMHDGYYESLSMEKLQLNTPLLCSLKSVDVSWPWSSKLTQKVISKASNLQAVTINFSEEPQVSIIPSDSHLNEFHISSGGARSNDEYMIGILSQLKANIKVIVVHIVRPSDPFISNDLFEVMIKLVSGSKGTLQKFELSLAHDDYYCPFDADHYGRLLKCLSNASNIEVLSLPFSLVSNTSDDLINLISKLKRLTTLSLDTIINENREHVHIAAADHNEELVTKILKSHNTVKNIHIIGRRADLRKHCGHHENIIEALSAAIESHLCLEHLYLDYSVTHEASLQLAFERISQVHREVHCRLPPSIVYDNFNMQRL